MMVGASEVARDAETGPVVINVGLLFTGTAKLDDLPGYERAVTAAAGAGQEVVLTGQGPIWLYLRLAHALHGRAKRLIYRSPVTEDVLIFDHDPYAAVESPSAGQTK